MKFDLKILASFPRKPGVYLMKNKQGLVIYVGKAKSLYNRIRQYFIPGQDQRVQIPLLVAEVWIVETIVVKTEKEALLLENTLIKKHQPKYNIILKDDKTYISLMINHKHQWPMVKLVRYKKKPQANGLYFGPFTSAQAARETLDLIHKIFPTRQCSDRELQGRERPCILYEIHRCVAPCVNLCSKKDYLVHIDRVIKFFSGKDDEIIRELYTEMGHAADSLEFERAGAILRSIQQIEKTLEKQRVCGTSLGNADVLGFYRELDALVIMQMFYRGSKLVGSVQHFFKKNYQEDVDVLSSFIFQHYEKEKKLPEEIILPFSLPQVKAMEECLLGGSGRRLRIFQGKRGEKKDALDLAEENAKAAFYQERKKAENKEDLLIQLEKTLRLSQFPHRIECFDNSHTSGSEQVAGMVVYEDGEKKTSSYRNYKIKESALSDDYGMMRESLMRRYKKTKENDDFPSLLIVDGGKGQLNVALSVLEDLEIVTVDVISLVKEKGRHDKGMTAERVYIPNVKDPISLKKRSRLLFFLQEIRDEAHRFAINFQRKRQRKKITQSFLDDIPGIGPVKKQALLRKFGSVNRIRQAKESELLKVEELKQKDIKMLLDFLQAWGNK